MLWLRLNSERKGSAEVIADIATDIAIFILTANTNNLLLLREKKNLSSSLFMTIF